MHKALIVDDDAAVLRTLKMLFEARGFEVVTASSALEGIATLAISDFDLVVTDMRMETHTAGFDVVHSAKNRPGNPVVVILSAFPIPQMEWRKAGADAIFMKGGGSFAMIDEIERILHDHFRQHSAS